MRTRARGEDPCGGPVKPGAGRWCAALLGLVACHERQPASVPEVAPRPTVEAPAERAAEAPAIPEARRCGEAGASPTELPPLLAAGRAAPQTGRLTPETRATIGGVSLRYQRSAWIGTMRAGYHAPALIAEIDRVEANGGPWGAMREVVADRRERVIVGPYQIDLRGGPGEPPAEVEVAVTRDVCPAVAAVASSSAPRWLWLSSEGIRGYTYDLEGELLQLGLDFVGEAPRLDVSTLGYRRWFDPRRGAPPAVRTGRHVVTIERVEPDPKVSSGDPRLHVRARIEAAPPRVWPDAAPATSPCGDAGPARTRVPDGVASLPAEVERRELGPGQRGRLGALDVEYTALEVPAHGEGPYREEATSIPMLQFTGDPTLAGGVVDPTGGPRLLRGERELVRVEPIEGARARLRRFSLACPKEHVLADMPAFVWLSTLGHAWVRVGAQVNLQIYDDPETPTLQLQSERGFVSQRIGPELVGRVFSLDGIVVEIVDVQASDGTRFEAGRWRTDRAAPAVHVQLRVSPEPPG